jgi:hypothetical protein
VCAFAPLAKSDRNTRDLKSLATKETTMNSTERALRLPKAQTRAMRVSAEEAHRQLVLSAWIVSLLLAATAITATAGMFA